MNSESPYCLVLNVLPTDASDSNHIRTMPGKHKDYEIISLFGAVCTDTHANIWQVFLSVFEFTAWPRCEGWTGEQIKAAAAVFENTQQCPTYSYQE